MSFVCCQGNIRVLCRIRPPLPTEPKTIVTKFPGKDTIALHDREAGLLTPRAVSQRVRARVMCASIVQRACGVSVHCAMSGGNKFFQFDEVFQCGTKQVALGGCGVLVLSGVEIQKSHPSQCMKYKSNI